MKNSEKKIWFKAKRYGWGWYPCTWQGFAVLFVWLIAFVGNFIFIGKNHIDESIPYREAAFTFLITVLLIAICWIKGERPRWKWGN